MLASLSLAEGREVARLNAAKSWLACVMQGLAVVMFIVSGAVAWRAVTIVPWSFRFGQVKQDGGWAALPQPLVRGLVIAAGLGLSVGISRHECGGSSAPRAG